MEVDGLAADWEGSEAVRAQLRNHKQLCVRPLTQQWCEPTRPNCVSNSCVLIPALERLRHSPKLSLPYLEPLQLEVAKVYEKMGIPVVAKQIYSSAVEVKRMLGFVKKKANRHEVTKAQWMDDSEAKVLADITDPSTPLRLEEAKIKLNCGLAIQEFEQSA
eukprot:Skav220662  [mRNA]  locus=scaffold1057:44856:48308:+ [translate_table: standard]